MPTLADDQHDADFNVAAIENPASLNGDSVRLASYSTVPHSIRTLRPGEDLSELVDGAPGVVLLDFFAEWCGPCRRQSKVLREVEEFASERNAQIIKIDVDEHPELAKKYQVSSMPTLLAVKDGSIRRKKIGLTNRNQIEAMLR